jgi:ferredoxin/flavodoxin---NADP+ reductase
MALNKIVKKSVLAPGIVLFEIENRDIASHAQAGQFVVVRKDEFAERVPLTIADYDPQKGTLVLIIQEVGVSTKKLCALEQGDAICDVLGPLGHPTEIANFGTVVCIGGGVGAAPMYPITKALHRAGNRVHSIIGARSRDLVILKDEMKAVSDVLHVCTDDGSDGFKGFVSAKLSELMRSGEKIDRVWAIGPGVMMKAVCDVTRSAGIPTIVSLNTLMVDGTGMCGGCRITVGDAVKFVCVDGPEFDGHAVKFDELLQRSRMYHAKEKQAIREHECKLNPVR